MNATFALNRLEQNCADGVIEFRFEVCDVIEAHKFDAGNERCEGQAIFFGGGDAERAEGPAVKGILHRKNAVFLRRTRSGLIVRTAVEARELQGAFDRFGAAV